MEVFLGPREILPNVLKELILGYLKSPLIPKAYRWYQSLVAEINTSGRAEKFSRLPRDTLLTYLNALVQEDFPEIILGLRGLWSLLNLEWNMLLPEAAEKGHLELVKYWVTQKLSKDEQGSPRNKIINKLYFPLYLADRGGHSEIVKYLTSQGAHSVYGGFLMAITHNNIEMAQYFEKDSGTLRDINIESGLNEAARLGHLEMVKYLASKALTLDCALSEAASHGHLEIVTYLVERGARDSYHNFTGSHSLDATLSLAAQNGCLEMVKYLIAQGATNLNWGLYSLLKRAHLIEDGKKARAVAKYLVQKGARVHPNDVKRATASHPSQVTDYLLNKDLGWFKRFRLKISAKFGS